MADHNEKPKADFPSLHGAGVGPKITSIFDFNAEALGELMTYIAQNPPPIPISQVIGYKQATQATRVYKSGTQSILNATNTTITFDVEEYDYGELHSTSTNPDRITIVQSGIYIVGSSVTFAANAAGDRALFIQKNGATVDGQQVRATAAYDTGLAFMVPLSMAVADYATALVVQSSGGALNVKSATLWVARLTST